MYQSIFHRVCSQYVSLSLLLSYRLYLNKVNMQDMIKSAKTETSSVSNYYLTRFLSNLSVTKQN